MKLLINTLHPERVWNMPERYVQRIRLALPEIEIVFVKDKEQLKREIVDADVYFGWFPGKTVLSLARDLKWVHTPQIGVGRFISSGIKDKNFILTNASGVDRRNIGEFAISLFLSLYFGHPLIIKNYLKKRWDRTETGGFLLNRKIKPLKEMIAVVLGYGGIGKVIVEILSCMVKEVRVVKKRREILPFKVYTLDKWSEFLPDSDVVFIAVPSTDETSHFIDGEKIGAFKTPPFIINVGRGKVVNEKDLAKALSSGKISGYGTDVCSVEPPDENFPLWGFENVIVSPHIAALEPRFWDKHIDFFLKNMDRFLKGGELCGIVHE